MCRREWCYFAGVLKLVFSLIAAVVATKFLDRSCAYIIADIEIGFRKKLAMESGEESYEPGCLYWQYTMAQQIHIYVINIIKYLTTYIIRVL